MHTLDCIANQIHSTYRFTRIHKQSSCADNCGLVLGGGDCSCNDACHEFGDCCDDACDLCGACGDENVEYPALLSFPEKATRNGALLRGMVQTALDAITSHLEEHGDDVKTT